LHPSIHEKRLTNKEMRDQIISHIVSGHCADSLSSSRTRNCAHGTYCRQHVLRNFARDADLKDDGPSNEGAILKMVFNTISSRKTLFRVMRCNAIPCNPSDSLKQLRHILNRRIRFLDKQNASTSRLHEHRQTLCVTNPNANGPNGCRQYLRH